jgi:hypothetical protein
MDETPPQNQQDSTDEGAVRRSILRPSVLAGYKIELERRWSRRQWEQRSGDGASLVRAIAYSFLVVSAILAVFSAWRLIAYAAELYTYTRFAISGVHTQATVLRKRSEAGTSVLNPDRYIITYGFWSGDTGTIVREDVSRPTFDVLVVDETIAIVYLANNPRISRIERELAFPRPIGLVIILGTCVASFLAWRWVGMPKAPADSPPPHRDR